jgi:hypothetical protein
MHVRPLRWDVHIVKEPPSGSTFPTALEGSLDVFLPKLAMKRQANLREHDLLVPSRGIKVLE